MTWEVLIMADGTMEAYGPVEVLSIIIELDGAGIYHDVVTCEDRFRVEGYAQIDALVTVLNGDIEIKETGVMDIFVPYIDVDVPNGEFKVDGTLNLHNTCLSILNGNFRNKATGVITGSLFIEVLNGDIRDEGIWPSTVDWCASGEALTMPFPADCNACLLLLPIELVSFFGHAKGGSNMLYWSTASETNNDHFTLLKSLDGVSFESIATIDGAGNSQEFIDYSFEDKTLEHALCYYQLLQTDFNGHNSSSAVIAVQTLSDAINSVILSPSPANDIVRIVVRDDMDVLRVDIMNQIGELVFSVENQRFFDVSHLPVGVYVVRVSDHEKSVVAKLVKQ